MSLEVNFVIFKKYDDEAKMPVPVGLNEFNLFCLDDITIKGDQFYIINTGIHAEFPSYVGGIIVILPGISLKGNLCFNNIKLSENYYGLLNVPVKGTNNDIEYVIRKGQCFAKLFINELYYLKYNA